MADLRQLADLMACLGSVSSEEVLETVQTQDARIAVAIRKILECAPVDTAHLVAAVARRGAVILGRPGLAEQLVSASFDPRNFKESSEVIDRIADLLETDNEVGGLVDRALDVLIERRVLGLLTLGRLQRFLSAVRGRPRLVLRSNGGVGVADEWVERAELIRVAASYREHDLSWVDRALVAAGATIAAPGGGEEVDHDGGVARSVESQASSPPGHAP